MPATTTTSVVDSPIEENFSVTVAGAFGDMSFTPANARISVGQSNQVDHEELGIAVQDYSGETGVSLGFGSRDGSQEPLAVGYYADAQRIPFTDPGRPGISMGWFGFCDTQSGNFEIRDISRDGPRITRVWITFHRYCDDRQPIFGEVRFGYPVGVSDVSPRIIRWPEGTYPGRASYDTAVHVRPTASNTAEVTAVSIIGGHAGDFPIRDNGCAGVVGSQGCEIRVGFTPQAPGPRHAELSVATSSGTTRVSLDGAGALGQSDWVLDVDWEDPSRPNDHLVLPFSGTEGGPYEFRSSAFSEDSLVWRAYFDLWGAVEFAEDEYAYSPEDTGLRMGLSQGNAGCEIDQATVSIADLAFAGPDDKIALLDLGMNVHCRAGYGYTVRGRIRFHDRDDQTAPAVVTDVTAIRDGDQVVLQWTNPNTADLAGVIIRSYPGGVAPGAADTGTAVYFGNSNSTSVAAAPTDRVAFSIWTYDQAGNVSPPYELQIEP